MSRLAVILGLLPAAACTSYEMPALESYRGDRRMETSGNGFTATLGNWPEHMLAGRAWERQRMRIIHELTWMAGGCIPEKKYRIVERRVSWAPSSANPNERVATIHYVARCIRNRGCVPPEDPMIRDNLAQRAMIHRREGRPYYQGCRWIDAEIRRINRDGPLQVVPLEAVARPR